MRPYTLPLLFLLVAVPCLAIAADADAKDEEQGDTTYVTASVALKVKPHKVRAKLREFEFRRTMSPDVLEMKKLAAGSCERIYVKAKGLVGPIDYITSRCELTGYAYAWRETLIESDDLEEYESFWSVEETTEGSTLTARIRIKLRTSVPQRLLDMGLKRSLRRSLRRVAKELAPPKK